MLASKEHSPDERTQNAIIASCRSLDANGVG